MTTTEVLIEKIEGLRDTVEAKFDGVNDRKKYVDGELSSVKEFYMYEKKERKLALEKMDKNAQKRHAELLQQNEEQNKETKKVSIRVNWAFAIGTGIFLLGSAIVPTTYFLFAKNVEYSIEKLVEAKAIEIEEGFLASKRFKTAVIAIVGDHFFE